MFDEHCSSTFQEGKNFCWTRKFQMYDKQFLMSLRGLRGWNISREYLRPLLNDQTMLLKHLKLSCQAMFERLATSQNIAVQTGLYCASKCAFEFWQKHCETYFACVYLSSNVLRFNLMFKHCLICKFEMFSFVWPEHQYSMPCSTICYI